MELTITGANTLTYPALNIWNWAASLYLFLISAAAGLFIMSAVSIFRERNPDPGQQRDALVSAAAATALLFLGAIVVWLELDSRWNAFWVFLSFSFSSPMYWGGWCLALALAAGILNVLSLLNDGQRASLRFDFLEAFSRKLVPHTRALAGICCALGVCIGIYSGLALSLFVARPLWNSAVAPVLLLISALTTGAGLSIIISSNNATTLYFTRILIFCIVAELIAVVLYFLGQLASSAAKREAILTFFSFNQYYVLFEISFALTGVLLPLALVLKYLWVGGESSDQISSKAILRMKLSGCLVLAGGLIMRLAWVYLGQLSKLS